MLYFCNLSLLSRPSKHILITCFWLILLINSSFSYSLNKGNTEQITEGVCSTGHETYVINGSSILGKYSRAAVAVDNLECSKIGREILEKDGKTMDAALAAAICNGVMNAHSMGIGGGCVITVYSKYE
jgi:hypothetical protein